MRLNPKINSKKVLIVVIILYVLTFSAVFVLPIVGEDSALGTLLILLIQFNSIIKVVLVILVVLYIVEYISSKKQKDQLQEDKSNKK